MGRTKFKTPLCAINPITEKPFTRHKWTIIPGKLDKKDSLYYYHVVCDRPTCRLNSRNPVAF